MDKVTHFEIPADDTNRAQEFYKKLFGWKINQVPEMPYWMVNTVETDEQHMPKEAGTINGGIFLRERGQSISPVIVISVSDIDGCLKNIEEAGGQVVLPKQEVGSFGYYARFEDTEGNLMGLWQNME